MEAFIALGGESRAPEGVVTLLCYLSDHRSVLLYEANTVAPLQVVSKPGTHESYINTRSSQYKFHGQIVS